MTTTHPALEPPHRRQDIEGLRTIAVISVLLFHFFPGTYPGGFVGVDVFFVISGFVVTASVLRRVQTGTFRFLDFYQRRVRRLFPALVLVSFATLVTAWALLFQAEFIKAGLETFLASTMALNFKLAQGTGYFDSAAAESPNLHYWSLAVEEQFYLVWPAVLVLLFGALRRFTGTALGIAIAASFALNLWVASTWPDLAFYMLPTRAWEFAVGGALAIYASRLTIAAPLVCNAASLIGLALIVGSVFLLGHDTTRGVWLMLVPVLGTMLVIASPTSWIATRVLPTGPMTWLGVRSYPIYLWHWLPVVFHHNWFGEDLPPSLTYSGAMIAGVICAAHVTYEYVEQPFRVTGSTSSNAVWTRGRFAPLALVTASLLVGALGLLAWQQVVPERMSSSRELLAARADVSPTEQHLVLPGKMKDVLFVFGDSYTEQYIPEFQRLSDEGRAEMQIEIYTRAGCAPFPLINRQTQPHCLPFTNEAFELARRPEVTRVLIAASWRNSVRRGDYVDGATGSPVDPASDSGAYMWRGLERELATLVSLGKAVYVVLNPPGGPYADPAWIARHPTGTTQIIPIAMHNERVGSINAQVRDVVTRAGATALDPRDWLCNQDGCPVTTSEGIPIFCDPTHLRASYVRQHITVFDRLALVESDEAHSAPGTMDHGRDAANAVLVP